MKYRIGDYKGNMSEKLLVMINEIEREKQKKQLIKKYKKKYELDLLKITEFKKEYDYLIEDFTLFLIKFVLNDVEMVKFNSFSVESKCWVPENVKEALIFSNKLYALGKRKAAQEIWDSLIKDYKMLKNEVM